MLHFRLGPIGRCKRDRAAKPAPQSPDAAQVLTGFVGVEKSNETEDMSFKKENRLEIQSQVFGI